MGFAETFKALSDSVRRDILMLLREGRMSAGEIGSHFDMTGATISYHLNILKKAGLIFETKEKNYIYYTLNTSVVEEVMLWLSELKGGSSDDQGELAYFNDYKSDNFTACTGGAASVASVAGTDTGAF